MGWSVASLQLAIFAGRNQLTQIQHQSNWLKSITTNLALEHGRKLISVLLNTNSLICSMSNPETMVKILSAYTSMIMTRGEGLLSTRSKILMEHVPSQKAIHLLTIQSVMQPVILYLTIVLLVSLPRT